MLLLAQTAAKAVETVLNWDRNPDNTSEVKLTPEQKESLEPLKQALLDGRNPPLETLEIVGELLYRDGSSPVDGASAQTLKKLVLEH